MLPELPDELSAAELRELYRDDNPEHAGRFGVALGDAAEWPRYRKYSFHRFWKRRLACGESLDDSEVSELVDSLAWDFLGEVGQGVVGDAARYGLVPQRELARMLPLLSTDSYAHRQIRARLTLLALSGPTEAAIDALVELRTSWALRELVQRCASEAELKMLERCGEDARIIRSDRHLLREAIRKRRKEVMHLSGK